MTEDSGRTLRIANRRKMGRNAPGRLRNRYNRLFWEKQFSSVSAYGRCTRSHLEESYLLKLTFKRPIKPKAPSTLKPHPRPTDHPCLKQGYSLGGSGHQRTCCPYTYTRKKLKNLSTQDFMGSLRTITPSGTPTTTQWDSSWDL